MEAHQRRQGLAARVQGTTTSTCNALGHRTRQGLCLLEYLLKTGDDAFVARFLPRVRALNKFKCLASVPCCCCQCTAQPSSISTGMAPSAAPSVRARPHSHMVRPAAVRERLQVIFDLLETPGKLATERGACYGANAAF